MGNKSDAEQQQEEAIDLGELYPEEVGQDPEAGAAEPGEEQEDEEQEDRVTALRAELDDVREQWMRALADLDNFRKRAEREQRELKRYALSDPMRDLLPVVDNLERALEAGGEVEDLKKGVEMIHSQLKGVMRRYGVEEIDSVGEAFDPSVHDAVARFEDPETTEPTISDELQRGYRMHDRLLRPALVRVAMPAADAEPAEGVEAGDGETVEEAST